MYHKIVIGIGMGFVSGLIFGAILMSYMNNIDNEQRKWFVLDSADGSYSINVDLEGGTFLFGEPKVVIRCNNNLTGERINYFESTLRKLVESEYKSELTDSGVILTFYYEKQQRPISYVIEWDNIF